MADEILPSAPIDQFDEATSVQPEDWAVIFQISTGKTKKTRSSNFGLDSPSSNYNWSPTFDYAVDEVVEFQGKWYKSLDTPNLGNVPSAAGSLFWEETSKNSSSSLVKWAAGTYITDDVFVVYDDNQDPADPAWRIYALKNATRPFLSADFAVELAAGDWVAFVGGSELFKGIFASEATLISAWPDADPGNYAYVDAGPGSDVILYLWDDDDAAWIEQGNVSVAAWSDTAPGTVERSLTAEAQNVVTRALAGSSNASNSDARTPSEKGLVEMLLSFIGAAWTWASLQIFTSGIRLVNTTVNQFLRSDGSKNVVSVAAAAASDINTGTDDTLPLTSLGLQGSTYQSRYNTKTYAASTTAANTYTATLTPAITTYGTVSALVIYIKFTNANTGAATINLNTLGAVAMIRLDGMALLAGDIPAGGVAMLLWNGTAFILLNPVNIGSTAATVSTMAFWDSAKKLVSIAYAVLADFITGTDATKPLTVAGFVSFRSLVRQTASISAGTMTLDGQGKRETAFINSTAATTNFAIAFSGSTLNDCMCWDLYQKVTGELTVTFPSSCIAGYDQKIATRYSESAHTHKIGAVGASSSWVRITFIRIDSSTIHIQVSPDYLL